MPVQKCESDGKPGYRWGQQGKCYTYSAGDKNGSNQAKLKAFKQGMAAGEGGTMAESGVGSQITLTGAQVDEQGLSWIEVMPTVEKARNGSWYFTVTADDLGTLAEFIQANPDRIPIDYDHSSAEKGDTRAAGWFTGEAQVVDAGGRNPSGDSQEAASVWAQVKWTPTAIQEIRGGDFRFISPEWGFAEKDPKTGLMTKLVDLVAATLTNRPFFKDLAAVTAKADPAIIDAISVAHGEDIADLVLASLEAEDERTKEAAEAIVAATSTTEADEEPVVADPGETDNPKEIIVADEQPVTDYMKMLGLDETVDPKQRLAVAFREKDEKILALETKVTELTASGGEKSKQAEELTSRLEELEQKDRARDIEIVLARAVEKGRVLPAEKETLAEVFASDVTGLKRMIATRPAEMFVLEPKGTSTGSDLDRYVDDPDVSQYVKSLNAEDPVDTEQAKQHLIAMEILKDQGKEETYTNDEYVAAYAKAAPLVY